MKKQYTKKQIQEAIAYWKKQLGTLNEANDPYAPRQTKLELVFPDPIGNTELAPLTPEVLKSVLGIDSRLCNVAFMLSDNKHYAVAVVNAELGQHPTDDTPGSTAIIVDTVGGDSLYNGMTYSQFYRKTQGIRNSNAFIVKDADSYWCAEKITVEKYDAGSLLLIVANRRTDRIA